MYSQIWREEMRSEAQKRASNKWRATKMHRIAIDYTLADYEEVKQAAERAGLPVGTFCRQAIKEKIESASLLKHESVI